jgi:DNA-binding NtrC family response regulator
MKSVLVISTDKKTAQAIQNSTPPDYAIESSNDTREALVHLEKKRFDFIFIDAALLSAESNEKGFGKVLQQFWQIYPTLEIIVMATQAQIRDAVMAVKAGASNYLTYPINAEEINYLFDDIYEQTIVQSELDYLRDHFWHSDFREVVNTNNEVMNKTFEKIRSVAPTKSTVLISGETGTGKSVMANLIHQHSNRKGGPFISLHCGAIPETLMESELFGHEKGAFTGAIKRKLGKFEIAKGGTIFLDEIGTITPNAQIKLLQIIQEGVFQRVGGEETIRADVRIIAATNSDLKKMCDDGLFRIDLYYRLNVFPIEIPALRERIEDIPILSEIFIKKLNRYYQKNIHSIHTDVMNAFFKYNWPGNIRELENLIERAYILESSAILTPESFPNELFTLEASSIHLPIDTVCSLKEFRQKSIEESERRYLKDLLKRNAGKIGESAAIAGISTRQLSKLLKKYEIRKEEFKRNPGILKNTVSF